jgi:tetratricopeptide (TPR) repeat protein
MIDSPIAQARALLKQKPKKSIQLLTAHLSEHADDVEALTLRAEAYNSLEEHQSALADLERATHLAPDDKGAAYQLLLVWAGSKQYKPLIPVVQSYLMIEPTHGGAHLVYARALKQTGNAAVLLFMQKDAKQYERLIHALAAVVTFARAHYGPPRIVVADGVAQVWRATIEPIRRKTSKHDAPTIAATLSLTSAHTTESASALQVTLDAAGGYTVDVQHQTQTQQHHTTAEALPAHLAALVTDGQFAARTHTPAAE